MRALRFFRVITAFLLIASPLQAMGNGRALNTWAVLGSMAHQGSGINFSLAVSDNELSPKIGTSVDGYQWELFDDRYFSRNQDDYLDLFSYYLLKDPSKNPPYGRVAYLGQWIWSPTARTVACHFGFNDISKIYLNGNAISITKQAQAARNDNKINCALRTGWNKLVIKVVNNIGSWGGYFAVFPTSTAAVADLQFSPDAPATSLRIATSALPKGFYDQPYVELRLRAQPIQPKVAPVNFPFASPFEMSAAGGVPPYRWQITGLPTGLTATADGKIIGMPRVASNTPYQVTTRVTDQAQNSVMKHFYLTIVPARLPGTWIMQTRLGGLGHAVEMGKGYFWLMEKPAEFADIVSRIGHSWIAPTVSSSAYLDANDRYKLRVVPQTVRDALAAKGIRWGSYLNMADICDRMRRKATQQPCAPDMSPTEVNPMRAQENTFELAVQIMKTYNPPIVWLDSWPVWSTVYPYPNFNMEPDALFSMIKSMNPEALVLANGGEGQADYFGDADILSQEGSNTEGDPNLLWGRWPLSPAGRRLNPKYQPVDSWRFPSAQIGKEQRVYEWLESIVKMLNEQENFTQVRLVNFDAALHPAFTSSTGRVFRDNIDFYKKLANWMGARKHHFLGLFKSDLEMNSNKAYSFYNQSNGHYSIVIFEPRVDLRLYNKSFDLTKTRAMVVPEGTPVHLVKSGSDTILKLSNLPTNYDSSTPIVVKINP